MYKFKLGSLIQEKQTKVQARIIEINYKKHTYKLKFGKDHNFKIEEYDSFDVEKFWELKLIHVKSCTCGMWKVHGTNFYSAMGNILSNFFKIKEDNRIH